MKRYSIHYRAMDNTMFEYPDGEWVKYEDVKEALTIVEALSRYGGVGSAYYGQAMENLIGEAKLFQYNRGAVNRMKGEGE